MTWSPPQPSVPVEAESTYSFHQGNGTPAISKSATITSPRGFDLAAHQAETVDWLISVSRFTRRETSRATSSCVRIRSPFLSTSSTQCFRARDAFVSRMGLCLFAYTWETSNLFLI